MTKIKLKSKPKASKLDKAIADYDAAMQKIAEFREEHSEIFERYSELEEMRNTADALIRALAKESLSDVKLTKGKPLTLAQHGSFVVQASTLRKVNASILLDENPKLRKVARITYNINNDEVDRLLAAGVLTADLVKKAETISPVVKIIVSAEHEEPE